MNTTISRFVRTTLFVLLTIPFLATESAIHAQSSAKKDYTKADVDRLVEELSNWGRWGAEDQLGALNLITPEKRVAAANLVQNGISVSLARNVETRQTPDNPSPFEHTMLATGESENSQWSMDYLAVSYHGYAHSHLDSLCHLFHNGEMYNGFSQKQERSIQRSWMG